MRNYKTSREKNWRKIYMTLVMVISFQNKGKFHERKNDILDFIKL